MNNAQLLLNTLEQIINTYNPSLILCVIPNQRGNTYNIIKKKLCVERAGN